MTRFVLTTRAKQDLEDIRDYIADDNNIEDAGRVLGANRPGRNGPVYRHETKPLQIIRVLHGARDLQSILDVTPDEP